MPMIISEHYRYLRFVALMAPLLITASSTQAAQCRGEKVVQSCTSATMPGTPNYGGCLAGNGADIASPGYQSCIAATPPVTGPTTCVPVRVPCDYPNDIFDLFSRILTPER